MERLDSAITTVGDALESSAVRAPVDFGAGAFASYILITGAARSGAPALVAASVAMSVLMLTPALYHSFSHLEFDKGEKPVCLPHLELAASVCRVTSASIVLGALFLRG